MSHTALGRGREFDRIRAIADLLGPRALGLGDDCAFIPGDGHTLAVSSDLSVEGVHFRLDWMTLGDAAWRAAAAALSDLAAVGAEPIGVFTSIGIPDGAGRGGPDEMARGLRAVLDDVGTVLLGGDLSSAPVWLFDVTVLGRTERPVRRAGARPGDGVWVTGSLGGSRAALLAWQRGVEPTPEARERFIRPRPRLEEGRWLAGAGATAMMDLSDGLAGDCRHLAAASDAGIRIDLDLLPVDPTVLPMAARLGEEPILLAAEGGEDYELLVTLPPAFQAPSGGLPGGSTLTRIGVVTADRKVELLRNGTPVSLDGFDHFC